MKQTLTIVQNADSFRKNSALVNMSVPRAKASQLIKSIIRGTLLSNSQFIQLALSPFDVDALAFAKNLEANKVKFPEKDRTLNPCVSIFRHDLETFIWACNSKARFPKVNCILGESFSGRRFQLEWLMQGNVEKAHEMKRSQHRELKIGKLKGENFGRYRDFCYLVRVKLNVDTQHQSRVHTSQVQ